MRELKSGNQVINIRASNLVYTLFFQEFNSELSDELKPIEAYAQQKMAIDSVSRIDDSTISALMKAKDIETDDPQEALTALSKLGITDDPMILSGLIAMSQGNISLSAPILSIMRVVWAMNSAEEQGIPAFEQWVKKYEDFDFVNTFPDIFAEVQRGFFRSENTK